MASRRREPPNPALTPGPIYREAFRLGANPATTAEQAQDWGRREEAMRQIHGDEAAELAYAKEVAEHQDQTGLCWICGAPRHDAGDF